MIQVLWYLFAAAAALLFVAFHEWIPQLAVGVCAVLWCLWILTSVLSPAIPDRTCPRCGEEGLVKIRRREPGVRCERCEFRDETLHVAYLDEW